MYTSDFVYGPSRLFYNESNRIIFLEWASYFSSINLKIKIQQWHEILHIKHKTSYDLARRFVSGFCHSLREYLLSDGLDLFLWFKPDSRILLFVLKFIIS